MDQLGERVPVDRHDRQVAVRAGQDRLRLGVKRGALVEVRRLGRPVDQSVVLLVAPVGVVVPRTARPEDEAVVGIREVVDPAEPVDVDISVRRRAEELEVLLPLQDLDVRADADLLPEGLDRGRDLDVTGRVVDEQVHARLRDARPSP